MDEFPFPPGPAPHPWAIQIHLGLPLVSMVAVAALIWRTRQPAWARDLIGWLAFAFAALIFGISNLRDGARWPFAIGYAIGLGIISFVAIAMTVTRLQRPETHPLSAFTTSLGWLFVFGLMAACLLPARRTSEEASKRSQCKNNLKQIGLAFASYMEAYDRFPPPTFRTEGEPPRSWRVELLPYFDQSLLRKEYDNASPWNGAQNHRLAQRIPSHLQCPSALRSQVTLNGIQWQTTAYVMIRGSHAAGADDGRPVHKFSDGLANTIALVEASGQMIPWLKPEDVEPSAETLGINAPGHEPGRSRGIVSSYHAGGAHALMADGSYRFLNKHIDPKTLHAMLTVDGGDNPSEP